MKRIWLFLLFFVVNSLAQDHLLITEIVVKPTTGEFIEIYNPTVNTIDLSDYYITDATNNDSGFYYYNIVADSNAGGGIQNDFHAHFPNAATIEPGEYQTIAFNGTDFKITYNEDPDYELYETDPAITNMREALPGSINNQGGLTNSHEVVILCYWDGLSDLVEDVDYIVWGNKSEAVDKTGVSIDGPDGGTTPSTYNDDTSISQQITLSASTPHDDGESVQRQDFVENEALRFHNHLLKIC